MYPVFTGLAYATVSVAAVIFLHESLGLPRLLGILLVGVGVILLTR